MVALREQSPARTRSRAHLRLITPDSDASFEPLPLVRRNTLPDHADYRDTGCDIARSCLRCPLHRCKYDDPGGTRRTIAEMRDREIALLRRRHRAPIDMLADTYGLTRRHIFRILRQQP